MTQPESSESTAGADNPGVLVRPPLLYLGALGLGLLLELAWPLASFGGPLRWAVAGLAVLGGLALAALAMRRFRAAGTNVPTPLPATALVTEGPYRVSRNPIYLGLTLIYLGIGIAADSIWVLGLLVPVLVVLRYGVIAREERYLERKFGRAYRDYRARVRRWL